MLSAFQHCVAVSVSPIFFVGKTTTTFRFYFSKNPCDILVEILMGLAVSMCDEFSMFSRKPSQSICRYVDSLIFDIVVLMLSNCRYNPIILESILLQVGFLILYLIPSWRYFVSLEYKIANYSLEFLLFQIPQFAKFFKKRLYRGGTVLFNITQLGILLSLMPQVMKILYFPILS